MQLPVKNSVWRSRLTLTVLALVFLAPVLGAWWLYSVSDRWRPDTVNHGVLVVPPRPLDLPHGISAPDGSAFPKEYLRGRWTLVYIGDADCEPLCAGNLYKMRQVRLAQGENMNRVQRLFLITGAVSPLPAVLAQYPQMDVAMLPRQGAGAFLSQFVVGDSLPAKAERVYLVDPRGNLMMYYAPDAEPKGMLEDLQRLLKISSIG